MVVKEQFADFLAISEIPKKVKEIIVPYFNFQTSSPGNQLVQ